MVEALDAAEAEATDDAENEGTADGEAAAAGAPGGLRRTVFQFCVASLQ